MNYPDRVVLIDGTTRTTSPAQVTIISSKEAQDVFNVSDVSVRVPRGLPLLPSTGKINVLSGPYIGRTLGVTQVRPNRDHVRYIVTGIV